MSNDFERMQESLNRLELKLEEVHQRAEKIVEMSEKLSIRWHALKQWFELILKDIAISPPTWDHMKLFVLECIRKMEEFEKS